MLDYLSSEYSRRRADSGRLALQRRPDSRDMLDAGLG
jgi:hypothetical protein